MRTAGPILLTLTSYPQPTVKYMNPRLLLLLLAAGLLLALALWLKDRYNRFWEPWLKERFRRH
ncbi:MAG: hypothetical protein MK003_13140 [Pseudomonadales bacterium]|nr:hypothetical protein [Pseudomonadales bacterium]